MHIDFSPDFNKKLKKIKQSDSQLSKRIVKQLKLFSEDSKHPSLRLHKLSGEIDNRWSISITMSIRMVYILEEDTAYFIDVGTHDEVYRK